MTSGLAGGLLDDALKGGAGFRNTETKLSQNQAIKRVQNRHGSVQEKYCQGYRVNKKEPKNKCLAAYIIFAKA